MNERMTPIPFENLLKWVISEYNARGSMFGVYHPYKKDSNKTLSIFGEKIETPFGPAAGPNTQLAQNIIAAYFAGSRFFELKTVQIIDGEKLAACISRPCILAEDEGYNCEWSTELTVSEAMNEYIKAWMVLKIISRKYDLGSLDGFVFNMSVGYDLEGIKSEKIDNFIEGLKCASNTAIFNECNDILCKLFPDDKDYISAISPKVCSSVTLSTLHGCPPQEIERIATYLIKEKKLHTYIKCNPTILGYKTARSILDSMGYDYVAFDEHHFNEDLQYADAVPMFKRLSLLAKDNGLEFGLKLSNTFPVDVKAGELPSEEMYMSGRALFPLTVEMAYRISKEFDGKMRISYSGGADYFNIGKLFEAGIWPITVATTILKPGGYQRMTQIAQAVEKYNYNEFDGVDVKKIAELSTSAPTDKHYIKPMKPFENRKLDKKVPLFDCFIAPCKDGCPIGQDIPEYVELCKKGDYKQALKVITEKNPLPFITGTICAHHCMDKCTRNFYDESVKIRDTKLLAANMGFDELMSELSTPPKYSGKKVAVIGGGPTGMSAAYFVARAGIAVTIFEKESSLGGIVRHVIPEFRISDEAIDKDIALIEKMGVEIKLNTKAPSIDILKQQSYTHILIAVGALKAGKLDITGNVINVIEFLKDLKSGKKMQVGSSVAVIGGGNTAMDAARAAKRINGVEKVTLVYRRTKRYMPADEEELALAIGDGVEFMELVSPVKQENGILYAKKMILGEPDSSGRRRPVQTDEIVEIAADTVISAIGEQVDETVFKLNGIYLNIKGKPDFCTNVENVYVAGDAYRGPATVVEGIADAARFAEAVIGKLNIYEIPVETIMSKSEAIAKKGILAMPYGKTDDRCLACNVVCECCADVCPNRANVVIKMEDSSRQILHIDRMCNECGNCETFCPYDSAPYKDKFTLFHTEEDFNNSKNDGFYMTDDGIIHLRIKSSNKDLPKKSSELINTIINEYGYLL